MLYNDIWVNISWIKENIFRTYTFVFPAQFYGYLVYKNALKFIIFVVSSKIFETNFFYFFLQSYSSLNE